MAASRTHTGLDKKNTAHTASFFACCDTRQGGGRGHHRARFARGIPRDRTPPTSHCLDHETHTYSVPGPLALNAIQSKINTGWTLEMRPNRALHLAEGHLSPVILKPVGRIFWNQHWVEPDLGKIQ